MIRSRITTRSQTTIPRGVREALGILPGQDVGYIIDGEQVRLVNAARAAHDDPVLGKFLRFLERDLSAHPERLRALSPVLIRKAQALTADVEIDHDTPIDGAPAI
jgi:antitoxin PrlF